MIAVRKELKYVTTEVEKTKEKIESLWVLIDNGRIKIRIGVVYFPQEQDQDLRAIPCKGQPDTFSENSLSGLFNFLNANYISPASRICKRTLVTSRFGPLTTDIRCHTFY